MVRNQKKVLMISYFYPPHKITAASRAFEFNNFLSDFGWKAYILTTKELSTLETESVCRVGQGISFFSKFVSKLAKNQQANPLIFILRAINRLIFFIDDQMWWILPAFFKSLKIIKSQKIDLIYISCGPFSQTIIGYLLKKITKKPLVFDFRDGWSVNPYLKIQILPGFKWIHGLIEKIVLQSCDYLITTSPGTEKLYRKKMPEINIKTILHGYNPDINNLLLNKNKKNYSAFSLIYAGGLNFERKMDFIVRSMATVKDQNDIQLIVYGDITNNNFLKLKNRFNVKNIFYRGIQSQEIIYEDIRKSHLCVILQGFEADKQNYHPIAGKTYEYLAFNKPILYFGPAGDNLNFIRQNSLQPYFAVTENRYELVDKAVKQAYRLFKENKLIIPKDNKEFKQNFSKRKQTMLLSEIFNQLT